MVMVPTSGEKVHCPGCGQKFRFDAPVATEPVSPAPAEALAAVAPQPEPVPAAANEVKCPRCGQAVLVPLSGDKVRCPGCGQKFRFDLSATTVPPPDAPAEAPAAGVPPPVVIRPTPTAAEAEEFRALWPAVCRLVSRVYEDHRASDSDRVLFRAQADRAAALGMLFLQAPGPASSPGHVFITSVLPEITLDEILGLSLEDFRGLAQSLDEAQQLLTRGLPPLPTQRPAAPKPVAQLPPQPSIPVRPRRGLTPVQVGVAVVSLGIVVAIILGFPWIEEFVGKQLGRKGPDDVASRGRRSPGGRAPAVSSPTPGASTAAPLPPTSRHQTRPEPGPGSSTVAVPTFVQPQPPRPGTSEAVAPPLPPPEPLTPRPEPKRVFSRWKPGPDGWIALLNNKDLDGLATDADRWSIKDNILYGTCQDGATTLTVREADWSDYCFAVEAMLAKTGTLVLGHGRLTAVLSGDGASLGTPQQLLDEQRRGLSRREWHRVELDVKGSNAEVRVNGRRILFSSGYTPEPGAPSLQAQQGAVAFRSARLRLHESDAAYRAVTLGEGLLVAAPKPEPGTQETPTPKAELGLGAHRLFNGTDLDGWTKNGAWAVQDRAIACRAPAGLPATLVAGSPDWRDCVLRARCRIVRKDAVPREGEYFLVIFRCRDPQNFSCIRFPVEGIYEIGYYQNGRFHETSRARFGLGPKFNKWHDIEVTVRDNSLSLVIDNVSGMPPWNIAGPNQGQVGLGVAGGEATFESVQVNATR
jgi:hypothetical protein